MGGRLDEAVTSYEEALALRPDYALAHNNLGAMLLQRGRLDAALVHLREAVRSIRITPKPSTTLDASIGGLAIFQRRGNTSSRRPLARPGLASRRWSISPGCWPRVPSRARPTRSAPWRLAQRAVNLTARRDIVALDALAGALAAAGDFDRAIAVLDEALKIAPNAQAADVLRQRQTRYRQHHHRRFREYRP